VLEAHSAVGAIHPDHVQALVPVAFGDGCAGLASQSFDTVERKQVRVIVQAQHGRAVHALNVSEADAGDGLKALLKSLYTLVPTIFHAG
jgi:hypothetical protein